jgi:hypothetical protein
MIMANGADAEEIRRYIDRGLARYGRGEFREALEEWQHALDLDADNGEARTLIDFVRHKLLGEPEGEGGKKEKRPTDPVLPSIDEDRPTARGGNAAGVVRPTIESPIPSILAQITNPSWTTPTDSSWEVTDQHMTPTRKRDALPDDATPHSLSAIDFRDGSDTRDDAAPQAPLLKEDTRRLGSEPHTMGQGRVPQTMNVASPDAASEARMRAAELVDRCRAGLDRGDLVGATEAAEKALAEGERAPAPGIPEVIEPARALFERAFEKYVGSVRRVPIFAMSGDALAVQQLDHRAGFMLSRIDGAMTVEQLLDVAGMPRFEALRSLAALLRVNAIRML